MRNEKRGNSLSSQESRLKKLEVKEVSEHFQSFFNSCQINSG